MSCFSILTSFLLLISAFVLQANAFSTFPAAVPKRTSAYPSWGKYHNPISSPNHGPLTSYNNLKSKQLYMCICIDCARVTNCAAYHFVENKHEQPNMTEDPTFEPREGSPTIHVNIRTIRNDKDREEEMKRMWREHGEETAKAEAKADTNGDGDTKLIGEQSYDLTPVTTYEYDVVACEDFVQEKGCWVKNMPEKIRLANPDFVPS